MLVFVGVSIVVRILAMILLAIIYRTISGEEMPRFEDERDKQIELRVNHIAQTIFIIGFVGALVPIAMGRPVTVMFAAFVVAGLISEMVSETVRIHMYRRGV